MPDAWIDSDGPVPAGLLEAFRRYERALMADDITELDALFASGAETIRSDIGGVLVGHGTIGAFRRGRGGAPKRTVLGVHVRSIDDATAVVVAELLPVGGGRGQQTQVWRRGDDGWTIATAHVSATPPGIDTRVWRVIGTPLVAATDPSDSAPLRGLTVAVKDLFAVAGHAVGGGVPAYLASAPIESVSSPAVRQLLEAGASVAGIARTDEFAYSIAGANPHYGTPPNPAVPGGLPGGSSSGPASAVALGHASVGLATDTGGSIRVPASYQGLWGLRTTHGAVPTGGLLPLAPTFDTAGWLTRDRVTLRRVADVAFADHAPVDAAGAFAVAPALLDRLPHDIRSAFDAVVDAAIERGAIARPTPVDLGDLPGAVATFRTVQFFEAWQVHGAWIASHPGAVSGAVADRFAAAAAVTDAEVAEARISLAQYRAALRAALTEHTLLLPSAASAAPQANAGAAAIETARQQTLQLTCFAGLAGAPALSAPLAAVSGGPLGVCLVGAVGSDRSLLDLVGRFVVDSSVL